MFLEILKRLKPFDLNTKSCNTTETPVRTST